MSGEANREDGLFSDLEIDTIGEIMNISMGSAATAATTLVGYDIEISEPQVIQCSAEDFSLGELDPAIAVRTRFTEGLDGEYTLFLGRADVAKLLGGMLGGEVPEAFEEDEIAFSALGELTNQMMGSAATVLSCFLGRTIHISTPQPLNMEEGLRSLGPEKDSPLLVIRYKLAARDLLEGVLIGVLPAALAKEIITVSLDFDSSALGEEIKKEVAPVENTNAGRPITDPAQTPQAPPAPPEPAIPQAPPAPQSAPSTAYGAVTPGAAPGAFSPPPAGTRTPPEAPPVVVKDYSFSDLDMTPAPAPGPGGNMDLVLNVPVTVTVELGRTKKKIKEILEFGQGTLVELDKQAGSQVDVIVNGQLIARGDVVVVDDNFSIRITEILKNRDSLSFLD